jgi:hypothetical protein
MEFILIIVAIALYFLPSIVGYNKRNAGAIILLNFFLGWTLLGWVIALVWASTADDPPSQNITYNTPSVSKNTKVDQIERLKNLLDKGALTKDEYEREKSKILELSENSKYDQVIKTPSEIEIKAAKHDSMQKSQ